MTDPRPDPDSTSAHRPGQPHVLNAVQGAKRLHPMTLVQRVLVSLPALAFILLPALTAPDTESWFSLFFGLLYAFVALPAIVLQYLRFSYRITPREITIQSGVLTRKNRSIPIERVQNIQIEQTLLPRLTGTAKVQIETAGSTSTEGVLEYVSLDEAHAIRRLIRSFKRQQQDRTEPAAAEEAPTAAPPAEAEPPPLFAMSLRRVLLSGAFRFSILYIALIFSGIELLNPDPDTIMRWFTRGEMGEVMETAMQSPWLAAVATILTAGFFAWITGIAVNLNRYYNFRLWHEDDKLRFRHGLLTLAEGTIPLKKVQALILRTNPLMRLFGWYALEVQTVGLNVEEQGHRVVVPFARRREILPVAQHIAPFDPPDAFTRVSPLTIRRHAIRYTVALVALTATVIFVTRWLGGDFLAWNDAWWMLAALPAILGYAVLHYRHHGYAVTDDGFYVRRGVVKQYTWFIPIEKYHVFYTTASIFQRRLGLRSLFVDTAGAALFAYPEVIDVPEAAARTAQSTLYDQFRSLYAARLRAAAASASKATANRPSIPEKELREL